MAEQADEGLIGDHKVYVVVLGTPSSVYPLPGCERWEDTEGALLLAAMDGAFGLDFDLDAARVTRPGADLSGLDLRWANLIGARLSGARLSGANLYRAYLNGAYLTGANLHGAYLNGTNLTGADLIDADLRDADLTGASRDESDPALPGWILVNGKLRRR